MKNLLKLCNILALIVSISFFTRSAFAWDGITTGKIVQVDVTGGQGNYNFRVILAGSPALCSGGATWAFVNEIDSNYKVYVATLLAARMADRQVLLYTTNVANGFCQIGYITVL